MQIDVEVSAKHLHISEDDFKNIFHKDALTVKSNLKEKPNFSAVETVDLVGPKNTFNDVRIVGPFREKTQIELSNTDCYYLGIKAPLKLSGDLPGADITIKGPGGTIVSSGAIIAKRHMHISENQAKELNLQNGDNVKLNILGERGLIFDQIVVRISNRVEKGIEIDTDEANAAGIPTGGNGELII